MKEVILLKSYIVHFVRHGMTRSNLEKRYTGITDVSVCDEGIEALQKLKHDYEYPDVKRVFASPLSRCRQTAKLIFSNTPVEVVDDLREIDFGDFENKTADELSKNVEFKKWLSNGFAGTPPNGEDVNNFHNRIFGAFEKIVLELMRTGDVSAAVVSHGGVIMRLLNKYAIDENMMQHKWFVGNGCGYSVRITPAIWMRCQKFEVIGKVPFGINDVFPQLSKRN